MDDLDKLQQEFKDAEEICNDEGSGNAAFEESILDGDVEDDIFADMAQAQAETEDDNNIQGIHGEYLIQILERIKAEVAKLGQPKCYYDGTFWIHPRDPLFALNKSWNDITGISATELYHYPVFVWIPDKLPKAPSQFQCPDCHKYLTRHGEHY